MNIPLIINPFQYPQGFPTHLDLSEEDPISYQNYDAAYLAAQNAGIPYYCVTVAESIDEATAVTYYHTFDTLQLDTYLTKLNEQQKPLIDPVNRQRITRVFHFALSCFDADSATLFRPTALPSDQIKVIPFAPLLKVAVKTMLNKALNYEHVKATAALKQEVRRMQYLIADLIQEGLLFPQLRIDERRQEKLKWLWCGAQDSIHAAVALFMCSGCCSYTDDLLRKVSLTSDPKLPRVEREAIQEAKRLVKAITSK